MDTRAGILDRVVGQEAPPRGRICGRHSARSVAGMSKGGDDAWIEGSRSIFWPVVGVITAIAAIPAAIWAYVVEWMPCWPLCSVR